MKKNLLASLVICIALFSCSTSKKSSTSTANATSAQQQTIESAPVSQQDGSSIEKAIVINEKSSGSGIRAEYAWVRANHPNSRVVKQQLIHRGAKSYDILTVQKSDGNEENVYFDITNFFGKF